VQPSSCYLTGEVIAIGSGEQSCYGSHDHSAIAVHMERSVSQSYEVCIASSQPLLSWTDFVEKLSLKELHEHQSFPAVKAAIADAYAMSRRFLG